MESGLISQFVSNVISFTSQYSDSQWRAANLIGPPLTNQIYGDNSGAWCPATADEDQTLVLEFETFVYISQIKIYENFNGGAVTKIEVLNGDIFETLWSRETPTLAQFYNIFSPSFPKTLFQSNRIRLSITQTNRNIFTEIEAVELIGSVINLEIPPQSLTNDITNLLRNSLYADMEIYLLDKNGNKIDQIKCHKNIVAVRSETFFKYLEANNNQIKNIQSSIFRLIVEFIYSDALNEILLESIIQEESSKSLPDQTSELSLDETKKNFHLDFECNQENWFLVINNIIRLSIFFKLERLEKLLLNYLIRVFIDLNNVLNILLDSLDGDDFSETNNENLTANQTKICLKKVEEICLSFIKFHIKQIIKLEKFAQLPKDVLIKIVRTLN